MFSKLKKVFTDFVINRHRKAIYDAVEDCQDFNFVWCINLDKYADNTNELTLTELAKKQVVAAIASHIVGQYFWWTSVDRRTVYRYTKYVIKNAIGVHYHGCDVIGRCAAYHFSMKPGYNDKAPAMLMIDQVDMQMLKKSMINRLITHFVQTNPLGGHLQQVRYTNPETRNTYSFWVMQSFAYLVKK